MLYSFIVNVVDPWGFWPFHLIWVGWHQKMSSLADSSCWFVETGAAAPIGACNLVMRRTHPNMHSSFWMHWFPSSLLLLNVDSFLRLPRVVACLARWKKTLGGFFTNGFCAAMLLLSFLFGTKPVFLQIDWQGLGFSDCRPPNVQSMRSSDTRYALACLPFELVAFSSLHLMMGSKQCKSSQSPLRAPFAQLVAIPVTLRDLALNMQLWHRPVIHFLKVHFPAWMLLKKDFFLKSFWAHELLFFGPSLLLVFLLSALTFHFVEKPWGLVLRRFSERCSTLVLRVFIAGYSILCCLVWYTDWIKWLPTAYP